MIRPIVLYVVLLMILIPSAVQAHAYIDSPTETDEVEVGEPVTVTWSIRVTHGPGDTYDLMYSTDFEHFQVLVDGAARDQNSYEFTPTVAGEGELMLVQHGADDYTFVNSVFITVNDDDQGDPDPDMGDDVDANVGPGDLGADVVMVDRPQGTTPMDPDPDPPERAEDVLLLMEQHCALTGCHAAPVPQVGIDLTVGSYAENLVGRNSSFGSQDVLVPCASGQSELIDRLRAEESLRMPPRPEPALPEDVILQIERWIDDGAAAEGPIDPNPSECVSRAPEVPDDDEGCQISGQGTGVTPWLVMTVGLLCAGVRRRIRG